MTERAPFSRRVRALELLTSRRFVVWLIALLGVYVFLGTLVPQGPLEDAEVARWAVANPGLGAVVRAVGFHDAYGAPLFLVLVAVLFMSTTLCAWQRTVAAIGDVRGVGTITASRIERLKRATPRVLGQGVADPLDETVRLLRRPGTVVRTGPKVAHVVTGLWGPVGSAAFHICLALLIATIGLGRLTRAEGFAGAVQGGGSASLAVGALRQPDRGALHLERSRDLGVRFTRFEPEYRAGGVLYRDTPYVELMRGDRVLAEQWVHANNPLRHGSLLIHKSGVGVGVVLSVRDAASGTSASETLLLDFDSAAAGGLTSGGFAIEGVEGVPALETSVTVALGSRDGGTVAEPPTETRAVITVTSAEMTAPIDLRLRVGEGKTLPGGIQLQVDRIAPYARLSVVDDPSIYPIYALFVLAALGLTAAMLMPFGQAWLMLEGSGQERRIHVVVSSRRAGPLFAERIESAISTVTAPSPASTGTVPGDKESA